METFDNTSKSFGLKLNEVLLSVSKPGTMIAIVSMSQLIVMFDAPVISTQPFYESSLTHNYGFIYLIYTHANMYPNYVKTTLAVVAKT